MTEPVPRVAFFSDSFHEVNGVAHTSRQLEAHARKLELPFLSVHAGPRTLFREEGQLRTLELSRSEVSIALDRDLSFDPFLMRHRRLVAGKVKEFRPDLIHVTSPGDVGILGAWVAHHLRLPLVASWHTNVHEFGARRLEKFLGFLPPSFSAAWAKAAEKEILNVAVGFYRRAQGLLVPNRELAEMLAERTGRPARLMGRGVDTNLFSPARRDREDGPFTLGYVGRLTPEKDVRFLATLERALVASGRRDFRFVVVGQGSEFEWLSVHLRTALLPGVLRGEALARAYANMDLFVFPSRTDTYGNVVLEALASGVPAVVTADGGPKFLVESGVTGFVAATPESFIRCVSEVLSDSPLHRQLRAAAREHALRHSWKAVFEDVYAAYRACLFPAGTDPLNAGRSLLPPVPAEAEVRPDGPYRNQSMGV